MEFRSEPSVTVTLFVAGAALLAVDTGEVPLDILERQVDAYIRSNGGKL